MHKVTILNKLTLINVAVKLWNKYQNEKRLEKKIKTTSEKLVPKKKQRKIKF